MARPRPEPCFFVVKKGVNIIFICASDIPGPSDIVVDGETGFLVSPGDIKALAEKMIYLLENPDVARKMGEKGRKRVKEHFDIRKTVKSIESIYESLLKENGKNS